MLSAGLLSTPKLQTCMRHLSLSKENNVNRSAGIDLLRILSFLIVLGSHYEIWPEYDLGGTRGVAIFFMVSGFCMGYSLQGRSGFQYLSARFWRLVPILLVCMTITAAFEGSLYWLRPDRTQSALDFLKNAVCLPSGNLFCDGLGFVILGRPISFRWVDGAYWSLLVEIRFYVLLWLLVYVLRIRSCGLVVAALACLAPLNYDFPLLSKGLDFLPYLSFFAFGMGVREFLDGKPHGIATAALAFFSFVANTWLGAEAISMKFDWSGFLAYAACFPVFLLPVMLLRRVPSGGMAVLGLMTYPCYLLHQDIGYIIIEVVRPYHSTVAGALIATLFVLVMGGLVVLLDQRVTPKLRRSLQFNRKQCMEA